MASAFCYYGIVLISTEILGLSNNRNLDCNASLVLNGTLPFTTVGDNSTSPVCDPNKCEMLTTNDYVLLLWTTLAEFPGNVYLKYAYLMMGTNAECWAENIIATFLGILLTIFVLDRIGRKKTMAAQFLMFAATIFTFCFPLTK